MDIEFIEEKYRDDVFQLMEITGLNISDSYQLLVNSNYSL